MNKIIVAIDGFSSCGKSTMAKDLAKSVGYVYVDSGAMYRAVTLYCINSGLIAQGEVDAEKLEKQIKDIHIVFEINPNTGTPDIYLNGANVEAAIRSMEVSGMVSKVSAIPFVRHAMVAQQQLMSKKKGVVMDGRDIGTVVFPDAEMKIFVTADPKIRAQRRLDELHAKGDKNITFEAVFENLKQRDHLDQTRDESPLKQAEDALILDNSYMTVAQQRQWLLDKFNQLTTVQQ